MSLLLPAANAAEQLLLDAHRNRSIPIEVHQARNTKGCTASTPYPVALLGSGYGIVHTQYQFLVDAFNQLGYLVVTIDHELPQDPPLCRVGYWLRYRLSSSPSSIPCMRFSLTRLCCYTSLSPFTLLI
ncbi:hypothetical protein D5R81_14125, partial [Parashewanella spongiae]